jgi:acetyl-CoA C-acetyltransferase
MGSFAQVTANDYGLTREGMDAYSIDRWPAPRPRWPKAASSTKSRPSPSRPAQAKSWWTPTKPAKGRPDKIPALKPAFAKDGTITAASSSSISDGAAAMVLTRQSTAEAKGAKPVAIVGRGRPRP